MRHSLRVGVLTVMLGAGLGCAREGPVAPTAPRSATSASPDDGTALDGHGQTTTRASKAELVTCTPRGLQSGSAVIGSSGGVLQVGDSYLLFPGGAVNRPIEISGEIPAGPHAAIRLLPEGLQFRKPVGLVLAADGCALGEEEIRVVYLDDAGTVIEEIDAEYFPRYKAVAASITHFSIYAVATFR